MCKPGKDQKYRCIHRRGQPVDLAFAGCNVQFAAHIKRKELLTCRELRGQSFWRDAMISDCNHRISFLLKYDVTLEKLPEAWHISVWRTIEEAVLETSFGHF